MTKTIKGRNLIIISTLYLLSGTIVRGGNGEAQRDVWLSMLVNLAVFTIVTLLYCYVCKKYPQKNLFSMFYTTLPKLAAVVVSVFYIGYGLLIGAMSWGNFTQFTSQHILTDSKGYVAVFFLALVCIYGAKKGIHVVGQYASFIFPFVVLILAVTLGLSIRHMDFYELLPVCYDASSFWNESLTLTAFPFGDTILLFAVYEALDKKDISPKHFAWGVWFAFGILTLIMVRNVAVLGAPVLSQVRYATYHAMGVVGVEDFFKRIEILLTFAVIFCDVVKGVIALLFVCQGICRVFSVESPKVFVIPTTFLMAGISLLAFDTNQSADIMLNVLRLISLPIQLLPIGLITCGNVRKKRRNE